VAQPPDDYHQRQRMNLIVAAIVAALVVGTILLLLSLHQGIKQEDCFAAGHRTCAPIDTDQR
jgi:hypothetical protein